MEFYGEVEVNMMSILQPYTNMYFSVWLNKNTVKDKKRPGKDDFCKRGHKQKTLHNILFKIHANCCGTRVILTAPTRCKW
jgi:hypothetical protein